ncbi:MAG: aldo/keto reductase [Bacillota bacterium]
MNYKTIPGTDLRVSSLCLGTAEMGTALIRDDSFRMLDSFLEKGGNFFDTAHVYANWIPGEKSVSEKTIGKWLAERRNRDEVVICTKGGHPELGAMYIPRSSRGEILADLNESLKFLGVDCIDVYLLHRDDPRRPVEEFVDLLNDQVREGKIRYFGCSNWRIERVRAAAEYAFKKGLQAFTVSQILWSLAELNQGAIKDPTVTAMDRAGMEFYRGAGVAVMAYTSQARGFFTKLSRGEPVKNWVNETYYNDENVRRLERLRKLAGEMNTTVTALVLAYISSQPFTSIPVMAPQTPEQLTECMGAGDLVLTPEKLRFLEKGEQNPAQEKLQDK